MAKTGHEMSILKRKHEYYKSLSDYLAKRCSKISALSKWGFSKSPSNYEIDIENEYAKFLEATKTEPDKKFDAMILAEISNKIQETPVKGYDKSIEAMFGATISCHRDTLNEITELCGIEL